MLSILVENRPGVLARIAGLFSRRGFNIDTLAVGPTEDPEISRITLTLDGAVHPIDQVTKQLHKLVNVIKIRDMEPGETIAREMALFKVSAPVESRAEIMQFAEIFRAKIVDVSRRTLTIEVTGTADKIEAFERMIRPHGLIEMVRTGEIAIARSKPEPERGRERRTSERRPRRRARCSPSWRGRCPARTPAGSSRPPSRSTATWTRSRSPPAPAWPAIAGSAGSSPTGASRSPGLGTAVEVVSRGEDRFRDLAERLRQGHPRSGRRGAERPARRRRARLVDRLRLRPERRAREPIWSSLPPALLCCPRSRSSAATGARS